MGSELPRASLRRTAASVGSMVERVRGILVGTALALLACCGGSSPTQPTTPTTPVSSVQISGPMVVATGGTIQLTATLTAGGTMTVASNATWQSQSPQIATVSSMGLVTGISPGQAFISATASGVTGQTFVSVQAPPNGTTALKTCGTINTPGNYTLANDLVGNSNCVLISNATAVHLDCGGHTSSGISMNNVTSATITNCVVSLQSHLVSVTSVTITQSTFNSGISIGNGHSVVVSDSTITSASVAVTSTSGNDVELLRDVISSGGTPVAYGVSFLNGSNNHVEQSTISSVYDGGSLAVGADDGIIMETETDDTIRGNSISGFFDLGVEGVGILASTTIVGNTISNTGEGAIGSYWCTDWTNDVVQGNHASQTPTLVYVEYVADISHCGSALAPPTFTNNQFIANVFRSPISGTYEGGRAPGMIVALGGAPVSGNLLQNNDFGSFDGPFLNPLSGFIDGGGNVCGPLDPTISNFVCTGGSASMGRFALLRARR